jgi:nucleoside-diphosphate-sugar epimerase
MAPHLKDPLLLPGSLILVTGSNGLVASHVVDQLLLYGYAVRGTVRSRERASWMIPLYQARHPGSRLEVVEVPNITVEGCYDEALEGTSAVIHTAAVNIMSDDPNGIQQSIDAQLNVLQNATKANKNGETIRRVVFTSSSWAVKYPQPNVPEELTYDTYEETAMEKAMDPNAEKHVRAVMCYIAGKVESEKASWKWIEAHTDAGFALNSVIPGTCFGPVLAPETQQYPTTCGFVRSLYEGKNPSVFEWLTPQWYVDVRDAARLHVAAAVLASVEGERIFAWAEPYTWPEVAKVLESEMGEVKGKAKEMGRDWTRPPLEKSRRHLERMNRNGFERFEVSVRANIRSFYPRA